MPAADTSLLEPPAAAPAHVAMATFDAALVCTYANDRFAEVAGLDDEFLVGTPWTALFPGLPPGQQALVDAVAEAGPAVAEVDVTAAATGRASAPVGARQRWRLVLHRVQGVPGVVRGRMLSVVGTLATGLQLSALADTGMWVADQLGKQAPALLGRAGGFPPLTSASA